MSELPTSIDDEKATLGSVLIDRSAIIPIAPWLRPAHFWLERHSWIYEAMLTCYDARIPPDVRTVSDELRKRDRLDLSGGIEYLAELVNATPIASHVEYYARIVERFAFQRQVIVAGARIAKLGNEATDTEQLIADSYAALDSATERPAADDTLVPLSAIVEERFASLHAAIEKGEQVQFGVPTGLRDLDEITGGLHKSDLIIIAARPSAGKSSLALTLAYNIAGAGHRVDIFSLEMSREQNVDRLIALHTGLNLMATRMLALRDGDLPVYMEGLGYIGGLPVAIDDQPALSVHDMRARILRRSAQLGMPAVILVDYLQLMSDPRARTRYEIVSESARGLKNLAKELNTPIIALSQLSRAVEGRTSHVPMLSDLRESGEIEQAADLVGFIYREEMYDRETDKKGIAELHIAKHRHGPVGVIVTRFDSNTTRFMDLSYRTPDGY